MNMTEEQIDILSTRTTRLEVSLTKAINERVRLLKEGFKVKELVQELNNIRNFIKSDQVKDLFIYSAMLIEYQALLKNVENALDAKGKITTN